MVGERQQPLGQRAVQQPGHLLDGLSAVSVQVGPAGVGDEQGVSGHHEPGVVAARAVRDDVRVMRCGMSGGGDRLDLRVAELEHLAVGERMVLEVDSGTLRQVRGRAGAPYELRQPRHVVGLDVRVEHGDDRHALRIGQREVPVNEVEVRVDDGELAVRLAAEQVGGARALVIQQLPEVHVASSITIGLDKLPRDLLNSKACCPRVHATSTSSSRRSR